MIWALPEWTFGPYLSGRLGVAFRTFGPNARGNQSGRLGVPPSNQQPLPTTATIPGWVELNPHQGDTHPSNTPRSKGSNRARFALRSKEATA